MRIFYTLIFFVVISATNLYSQEPQKQKTPEEIAIAETEKLQKELKLNVVQTFYVDSILRHNYVSLSAEFEMLKARGTQDTRTYQMVKDKWIQKNIDALKLVLDDQQFIGYLKSIGKGKEYKKGKDGRYYKKESKKKKNKK